jgi:3-deoxy-D-manno-octulosonic-acid transferase
MILYTLGLSFWALITGTQRFFSKDRDHIIRRLKLSELKKISDHEEKKGLRFLIHAVSVGEAKAILPLYQHLKKTYKNSYFAITSATRTGHEAAKRLLKDADLYTVFPIDFKRSVKTLLNHTKPDVIILSEGDLWLNFLTEAKNRGSHIFIASAKLSDRSLNRMKKVPFYTQKLLSNIDGIAAQSKVYADKFKELGVSTNKLFVTGNLKYDEPFYPRGHLRQDIGISRGDKVIVVGSTHEPEEALILNELLPLIKQDPKLRLIFVPRRPERWPHVESLLKGTKCSFSLISRLIKKKSKKPLPQLIMVDQMGLLCDLYTIADISIVAGSYTSKVGGHNIFEPLFAKSALIFGPYMHSQLPMREKVLNANAGLEVKIDSLQNEVKKLIEDPKARKALVSRGEALVKEGQGSAKETLKVLKAFLAKTKLQQAT